MKKGTKVLMAVLVTLLVLGIASTAGLFYAREHLVMLGGRPYIREAGKVDLKGRRLENPEELEQFPLLEKLDARGTGMTAEEYDALKHSYPRLDILWDVPFQGGSMESHEEKITLTSLKQEDFEALSYFKNLKSIDAWGCEDYAALVKLQEERPECKIFYSVSLGNQEFDCDVRELVLEAAPGEALVKELGYLPQLSRVRLIWPLPEWAYIEQAMEAYPQLTWEWEVLGFNKVYWGQSTEALALNKEQIHAVSQLEEILPYLPNLKTVDLRDCDLPGEELVDLANAWPEIDFFFNLTIGHVTVCTDAKEIDLSNHTFENTDQVERYVNCFPNLEKVIMCECGIPNEEMAALNDKYENIRFVWSVWIGVKLFRTDAVYYTPNKWGDKCFDESIYNLRYCTDMVCVDIGHMDNVTNCEWAAFMPNLKYLILAETSIRDLTPLANLKNLVFLELFRSTVKDYTPLLGCTALEDLNLSYTYGDPAPIYEMTWLKRLWWSGCWWEARNELPQVHPNTEMEFFEVSSTGGTWREGRNYYDMRDFIGMDYMTG